MATNHLSIALALLLAAAAAPAAAQGRFATRDEAARALDESRRRIDEIERTYAVEQQRCARAFAVNHCMEEARERRDHARREASRLELEAKDAQRAFAAAERADRRRAAEPTDDPIERARREAEARVRYLERERAAAAAEERRRAREAEADAARKRFEQRAAQRARQQSEYGAQRDPAVKALNVERYNQRQRAAAEHAKRVEAERLENERKRAERAAQNK